MSGGTEGLSAMRGSPPRAGRPEDRRRNASPGVSIRRPPVVGVALAAAAYLSVFYHVTDVVGGTGLLAFELAFTVAIAAWLGRFLRERTAVLLTAVGFALAMVGYFFSVPESARALFSASRIAADVLALLTGLSVLRLLNVGAWALLLAPVPTFLVTYLAVRRRYGWAAIAAAATTGFFVLTGDAGPGAALAAAVGATVAVGLAGLAAAGRRGLYAQWDTLAVIVAVMVVATSLVTVVPGSAANPVVPGAPAPTVEASLVANSERVPVLGSIRLSPEVRFVVEAERASYWRVGAYDRYTGSGWVRTGGARPYDGTLAAPPGETVRLRQQVTAKAKLDALPAAWKPVSIRGKPADVAQVTALGGLRPGTTLIENDTYVVTSEVPQYTERDLRRAGTDYPTSIRERYTQLPESTPDRVGELASRVIERSNASNPYEAAVAIERYLESTKTYSLDVPNPRGNVADTFLFEMDSGYCVYYATTMVVMLRTQGVPARFVTGYTPGQRVSEDQWVVRGLDSHAWVEVYFPDVGWVRFDPTPGGPRENTEQETVEEARASGAENVDAAGSSQGTYTTPTATPAETNGTTPSGPSDASAVRLRANQGPGVPTAGPGTTPTIGELGAGDVGRNGGGSNGDGGQDGWLPTRGDAVLGAAVVVGIVAGARRLGLTRLAYRAAWLLYQSRRDPAADAERAFRRLEYLAALSYRARRTGETPREFVETLASHRFGDRVRAVGRAYEAARYGGGVSEADAAEAVAATDELVRRHAPVLRRFGGRG